MPAENRELVLQMLRKWRDDLINMSRRNRLLYFNAGGKSLLEIKAPTFDDILNALEKTTRRGLRFFEPPELPLGVSDGTPAGRSTDLVTSAPDRATLQKVLKRLERTATQEQLDKGLNVLYLAIGLVRWKDADEHPATSPILLIPVTLKRLNAAEAPQLFRGEDDVAVNPALSLVFEHDFAVRLPSVEDYEEEGLGGLVRAAEAAVLRQKGWAFEPKVFLATFSFHKEVMFRDLKDNEDIIAESPLVEALVPGIRPHPDLSFGVPGEGDLDEKHPPEDFMTIRDADANQRQAIVAARGGRSFVMDGPPGTGKSQTIANIISELVTRGKTVLFVSEKAPALEVVYSRLDAAGLGEFVLELHSHKATRKRVAAALGKALESRVRTSSPPSEEGIQRLQLLRHELSSYAASMNEVRQPLKKSLHEVLGVLAALDSAPQAPVPSGIGRKLDQPTLSAISDQALSLCHAWGPVTRFTTFLWRDISEPRYDAARKAELQALLRTADEATEDLRRATDDMSAHALLSWNRSAGDSRKLIALLEHLISRPTIPLDWLVINDLVPIHRALGNLESLASAIADASKELESLVGQEWATLDPQDCSAMTDLLKRYVTAVWVPAPINDLTADQLQEEGSSLARTAQFFRAVAPQVEELGIALGVPVADVSLARAAQIAELGSLLAAPAKPEEQWLDSAALASARESLAVLRQLVEEWSAWSVKLDAVFTENVLDLDLEGLCVRFESVHKGLRKLRRSYWRDRRLLSATTRTGSFGRREIPHLREALQWKKQTLRLRAAEDDHAASLGQRYYKSTATNFARLSSALEVADRALALAGREYDRESLARHLGLGAEPQGHWVTSARELQESISRWQEQVDQVPEAITRQMKEAPLLQAAGECDDLATTLDALATLVSRVAGVAGKACTAAKAALALGLRARLAELSDSFASCSATASASLGHGLCGLGTDWAKLRADLAWAEQLRTIADGPVATPTAKRLLALVPVPQILQRPLERWEAVMAQVNSCFAEPQKSRINLQCRSDFGTALLLLRDLARTIDDIEEWLAFQAASSELKALGVGDAVQFCVEKRIAAEFVPRAIQRCVLQSWADQVIQDDKRLDRLRSEERDEFVNTFRELDRDFIKHTAALVAKACNARRPSMIAGPAATISHEAQKQKRHMPIRRLLEETAPVALAVKPCFMMSPLSVSSFLPPSIRFDVVIFDEASQVRPADAINCIYRGDQLIVAGDQRQLPPTSFFELGLQLGDEWEEDQADDFESILDLSKASGAFTSLPLRWHYRSQHEDLITYSNYSFYDGRLITFPGANSKADDLGVELFVVSGIYRRGGAKDNPIEAQAVLERVLYHTRHHPDLSLGVVAFSEAQASTIEAVWAKAREQFPEIPLLSGEDRLNGPFVKNLETVQGDERDIIIFSVAYGPDEIGRFTMGFGPINKPGGERRLNVAITRARRKVEVVSSVRAGDFREGTYSEGARHLKRFLDFAERTDNRLGALGMELGPSGRDVESPFEDEVARVIRSWGYDVVPQVGCADYRIDLGVRHTARPGEYALGVECDGAMYHSSRVARDRDRLRGEILQRLGWRLHRIWGPAWYRNRQLEEKRLRAAIDESMKQSPPRGGGGQDPLQPVSGSAKAVVERIDLSSPPKWTRPYVVARPKGPINRYPMHSEEAQRDLQRMIREVVSEEGPVHWELALKRVREAWGLQRAGSRIREAFQRATRVLVSKDGTLQGKDGFLRLNTQMQATVRTPTPEEPESIRKVSEIPPSELELAVVSLVREVHEIHSDEVCVRVARLFGWDRLGAEIAAALDVVMKRLVKSARLQVLGGKLSLRVEG